MVNGGKVSHWACVNFSRNITTSVASDFCKRLAEMCVVSGMVSDILLCAGRGEFLFASETSS